MDTATKPKRQMTEAQIRALAAGRKLSIEKRQRAKELKQVKEKEEQDNFEREYQEKVLKKRAQPPPKQVPIEETDEPVYPQPQASPEEESEPDVPSENDATSEALPPAIKQRAPPRAKPQPSAPNYKQEYYKYKLQQLSAKQMQEQQMQQQMQSYMQLPPYFHAADVARQQLKSKADDAVLKIAYSSIFPN